MARLLDLGCGGGGAAQGYAQAGFEVVGVDIEPQPNFPYEFHQADMFDYLSAHWQEFDVIHASPPCQGYSKTRNIRKGWRRKEHVLLIGALQSALGLTFKPYVIENVPGAPLRNPIFLTGYMFGLKVIRKRMFEIYGGPAHPDFRLPVPPELDKTGRCAPRGEYDRGQYGLISVAGHNFDPVFASRAMDIYWMTRDELAQAVPPAYTKYIGQRLIELL